MNLITSLYRVAGSWVSPPPCNCISHPILHHRHRAASAFKSLIIHASNSDSEGVDGAVLASEFARILNETHGELSTRRAPSHLLSPTAALSSVMEALQRKDWPEQNAGVHVAFEFTKRNPEDDLAPSPVARRRRSWAGQEAWLDPEEFRAQLIEGPYGVMIECDAWEFSAPVTFPSTRSEARAVQVVSVESQGRTFAFSFCMERMGKGSLDGCWLIAGVRQGDYSM